MLRWLRRLRTYVSLSLCWSLCTAPMAKSKTAVLQAVLIIKLVSLKETAMLISSTCRSPTTSYSWVRWCCPSRRISDDSTAGALILSERAASIKISKSYTIIKSFVLQIRLDWYLWGYEDIMPVCVNAMQGENARGVYNELAVHWNKKQILELCFTTYFPMDAFMQQEFNTAVATMNVKPTSSFMMHIYIHGHAEFIRSQVQILVNNVILLIIRAAATKRERILHWISRPQAAQYTTPSLPHSSPQMCTAYVSSYFNQFPWSSCAREALRQ